MPNRAHKGGHAVMTGWGRLVLRGLEGCGRWWGAVEGFSTTLNNSVGSENDAD